VIVVKSLYITFLIHKAQFAKNNYKIKLLGNMGRSLAKSGSFRALRDKADR